MVDGQLFYGILPKTVTESKMKIGFRKVRAIHVFLRPSGNYSLHCLQLSLLGIKSCD